MRTLPLTVLASEGPGSRLYLEALRRAGLRPARVLLMVWARHPTTGAAVLPWLPRVLRTPLASSYQDAAAMHWPRRIARDHRDLYERIAGGLRALREDAPALLEASLAPFDYASHADHFERLLCEGLGDPALAARLRDLGGGAVLFTGGGILPRSLLDLAGVRFLHVHPGFLPAIRGADGLLWSTLVRGRPGASCFYMARGIDTGDLIAAADLPALEFPLSPEERPADEVLYRALFAFYDPLLRATFLTREVLTGPADPAALPCSPQDPEEGITYHFLHPRLRALALARVFPDAPPGDLPS